jgi:hypothetical protein
MKDQKEMLGNKNINITHNNTDGNEDDQVFPKV